MPVGYVLGSKTLATVRRGHTLGEAAALNITLIAEALELPIPF